MRFIIVFLIIGLCFPLVAAAQLTPLESSSSTDIFEGMSKVEKQQFWADRDSVLRVRIKYMKAMKFQRSELKGKEEVTNDFLDLFESNAKVWNDLIDEPLPISPTDYAAIVRNYIPQGVEAEIQLKKESMNDLNNPRFFRYYRVGSGKNEHYMHLVIDKKIWTQIDKKNEAVILSQPKMYELEMVFHIDNDRKTTKIAEIKPIAH